MLLIAAATQESYGWEIKCMPSWREQTVHANGIDIHFWRTGGDLPPIILSHGLTDNGRCWQRVAETLGAHYDLIMPDARGHSHSSTPETAYRTEDRVADIIGLMDALKLDRVVAMGHSMGAETSALLAAQAPARIVATVLEDPPFRLLPDNPAAADTWTQDTLRHKAMSRNDLIEWGRAQHPTWSADTFDPWAEAKHLVRLNVYDWLRESRTDWRTFVDSIQAPTLLITGEPERGAIVTPDVARMITAQSPSVRTVLIKGAGHCIRYEQFDAYMQAVQNFLREVIG